jgi:hypothetical protein
MRQIPTAAEIVGPGIDALVALRPQALKHIDDGTGNYAKVIRGLEAQAKLMLRRLSAEAVAANLDLATDQELVEVADSEFSTRFTFEASRAEGEVYLFRPVSGSQGAIRKGHKFRRPASTGQPFSRTEVALEASQDVPVLGADTVVRVPVSASRLGAAGNIQLEPDGIANTIRTVTPFFDAAFTVTSGACAGGADAGLDRAGLVAAAKAYAIGQYGPVNGAIVAGAYRVPGVRHVASMDDLSRGRTVLFCTDSSWARSDAFASRVRSVIADDWQGFGLSVVSGRVRNTWVSVRPTVQLRTADDLADPDSINASIRRALDAYFDLRPDWWTWTRSAIRGVIARSDRRIKACTDVVVIDAVTGQAFSIGGIPSDAPAPDLTVEVPTVNHYIIADQGVQTTFETLT